MYILLLTAYFPPDTGSASHLFYELGTALAGRGHQVTVVTGFPGYHAQGPMERYRGKLWLREMMHKVEVVRVATLQFPRRFMVGRALWQFGSGASFFLAGLRVSRPDVAMVYSPPLPLGLTLWALDRLWGIPFVLNVQDLFPQSIIDLGLVKNRVLIRFLQGLERFVYRQAAHITVHSEGNRKHIVCQGVSQEKVTVIPNWVDTDFIRPGQRLNDFRRQQGLDAAFAISFAGVLGYSQDLDVVLEAADVLREQKDILFLIVGDGVERAGLEEQATSLELDNVRFLPMQPRERYPAVLHASDVCLATLHAQVHTPVVPSKIQSIMAAGRPVVASLPLSGDAPKLIAEAHCGLCVPAEDPQALAEAILTLYRDPVLREEMGRNGRRYAEEHLSLQACAARYEKLLSQVASKRR
jgi:colanic acid biosynthesis glycosyl transferase WcaI